MKLPYESREIFLSSKYGYRFSPKIPRISSTYIITQQNASLRHGKFSNGQGWNAGHLYRHLRAVPAVPPVWGADSRNRIPTTGGLRLSGRLGEIIGQGWVCRVIACVCIIIICLKSNCKAAHQSTRNGFGSLVFFALFFE